MLYVIRENYVEAWRFGDVEMWRRGDVEALRGDVKALSLEWCGGLTWSGGGLGEVGEVEKNKYNIAKYT